MNVNAGEKVRILSGGEFYVGVQTFYASNPQFAVNVGPSNLHGVTIHSDTAENDGDLAGLAFSHGSNGTNVARSKGAIAFRCNNSGYGRGDLCFYVDGTTDNNSVSSADERLRITSTGAISTGLSIGTDPWGATGNVNTGVRLVNADGGYAISANSKEIVAIFNRTNSGGAIVEYKYNGAVVGSVISDGTDMELHAAASNKISAGGSVRVNVSSNGQTLFKVSGSQTAPINDGNVPVQIAESSSSMAYFGANKSGSYGALFGYHTAYGGTVIRNVNSDDISFRVNNTQEKLRIKASGEVQIATRNSANSSEHAFKLGSFGIRTQDTGGFNWWRLDANYGSFNPFIALRADRRIGIYASNPTARIDIAYDSNQNGNAFVQFRGPNNKSGEMLHKNIHNGASGGGTAVNLFEVTSWQSSNSRIFGVVKVMQVNPLSNQGCQAEGWFFKADDGSADESTMTKVHDKGGSVGSLSWSGNTLRYVTPTTAYLNMHVSVEYHIYDGGTVVFDTTTRSL